MQRGLIRALIDRVMHQSARHIEDIARFQHQLGARLGLGEAARREAFAAIGHAHRGVIEPPALGALDLQYQHIVIVVMGLEALRIGRGEIDIGLDRAGELGLKPAAQIGQRTVTRLQLGQDQRRALLVQPGDLAAIHKAILAQPGAVGQTRLGPRHGQIALAQQVLSQNAINGVQTDQGFEPVLILAGRVQMGLFKDGLKERIGRVRREQIG